MRPVHKAPIVGALVRLKLSRRANLYLTRDYYHRIRRVEIEYTTALDDQPCHVTLLSGGKLSRISDEEVEG